MIRLLTVGAVAAMLLLGGKTAQAAGDPVNCTGYQEPRIQIENQSWWEPQVGPSSHPGTRKQGHIHVGMCFPLYQTVVGSTLHLDVTVKLHNMPGTPGRLIFRAYGDAGGPDGPLVPLCATSDCTYTYGYDFPLSRLNYSGWREFQVYLPVANADGSKQYNMPRWYVNFNVPKPAAPLGSTGSAVGNVGGDTWYSGLAASYARANVVRSSLPWSEQTGELTLLKGVWTPTVQYEKLGEFAYVDPAFHAIPPSKGIVVWEGNNPNPPGNYDTRTLSIDTTQLPDGLHRLVIGSSNSEASGANTGVLVVPFLVKNGC